MKKMLETIRWVLAGSVALTLWAGAGAAQAVIDGVSGTAFTLTAKSDHISTGDGDSIFIWGYALGAGRAQYPGPTLIVNQGDTIAVTLNNTLAEPVSIVFPGHAGVVATGGSQGLIAREAAPGGSVTYTFTATQPGTYLYHSGTRPELQVEMGLFGAIVVRPAGFDATLNRTAYGHPGSAYDREYLFLLSEMDPRIHQAVEFGQPAQLDNTTYFPVHWFINGRNAPDTMADAFVPWLPTQPYNSLPRMHPGEKLLMRMVSAGRDLHPFHHHGNNATVIAKDGRMLQSVAGAGPDIGVSDFTIKTVPGETADAIFEWTGRGLGWDIYGTAADAAKYDSPYFVHGCTDANADSFDDTTHEYCPDHDKPLPVVLPNQQDMTFGGFWSGSPFLGSFGVLPPGEGGLNLNGGLFFMWHSHTEKEIVNNDIFPGGMMTMVIVEPPDAPIP